MNPASVLKLMSAKAKFEKNHPKFISFLAHVFSRPIEEGTVIEFVVTLKLELSEEKTVITNVRTTPMKFLGVEVRLVKRNGRWVNHVEPERIRLKRKLESLKREIFYLRKINSKDQKRLIQNINRVNSIILGLVNYYKMCDQINVVLRVPASALCPMLTESTELLLF